VGLSEECKTISQVISEGNIVCIHETKRCLFSFRGLASLYAVIAMS